MLHFATLDFVVFVKSQGQQLMRISNCTLLYWWNPLGGSVIIPGTDLIRSLSWAVQNQLFSMESKAFCTSDFWIRSPYSLNRNRDRFVQQSSNIMIMIGLLVLYSIIIYIIYLKLPIGFELVPSILYSIPLSCLHH